jgi:hypothetical protein
MFCLMIENSKFPSTVGPLVKVIDIVRTALDGLTVFPNPWLLVWMILARTSRPMA